MVKFFRFFISRSSKVSSNREKDFLFFSFSFRFLMMISTGAYYAVDDVLFAEGSLFRIVSSLNPIKDSIFNGLPFSLSVRLRLTVMK